MLEMLEKLRVQAEQETAGASTTRRPSWAPALVLDGELLNVCRSLEFLGDPETQMLAGSRVTGKWHRVVPSVAA